MTNNQPFTPYIIGIGPGDAAYIYPLAQKLIEQAEEGLCSDSDIPSSAVLVSEISAVPVTSSCIS